MAVQKEQYPWHVSRSFCDVLDLLFPVRSAVNHSLLSPACTSQNEMLGCLTSFIVQQKPNLTQIWNTATPYKCDFVLLLKHECITTVIAHQKIALKYAFISFFNESSFKRFIHSFQKNSEKWKKWMQHRKIYACCKLILGFSQQDHSQQCVLTNWKFDHVCSKPPVDCWIHHLAKVCYVLCISLTLCLFHVNMFRAFFKFIEFQMKLLAND